MDMQTFRLRARAFALAPILATTASMLAGLPRPYGDGDDDDDDQKGGSNLATLIQRAGNAENAANELWRDNYQLRAQRRDLRAEVKALKEKQPAEGTVVLTKEQAAEWEAYQKLGKPADIEKSITEGKTAQEAVAKQARVDAVAKAAKDVGFNPEVLTQLTEMHKLTLSSQTVKVNDKDQVVHYVTPEGGQPTELKQYATANWPSFMPSLQVQQNQGQQQQQNQGQDQGGQPWLNQGGAAGGSGQGTGNNIADLATKMVSQRNGETQQNQGQQQQQSQQQGHVPGGPGTAP